MYHGRVKRNIYILKKSLYRQNLVREGFNVDMTITYQDNACS